MKIDWNELSRGFSEEMEKSANHYDFSNLPLDKQALLGGLWEGAKNLGSKAINGAKNLGSKAINGVSNLATDTATAVGRTVIPQGIQDTWNNMQQLPGQVAKIAPLAIGAMANMGGQKNQNQQPIVNVNLGGPKKNILNSLGGGEVGSLGTPKIGSAGLLGDAVSKAVQSRMVNNVIDKVIASDKAERPEGKELEIVSQYPEMSKLLEDEHNKAYLERLMKE